MDVFNLIYEALQIIYAIIPKELFIIILGIIIVGIYQSFKEKNEKKTKGNHIEKKT